MKDKSNPGKAGYPRYPDKEDIYRNADKVSLEESKNLSQRTSNQKIQGASRPENQLGESEAEKKKTSAYSPIVRMMTGMRQILTKITPVMIWMYREVKRMMLRKLSAKRMKKTTTTAWAATGMMHNRGLPSIKFI